MAGFHQLRPKSSASSLRAFPVFGCRGPFPPSRLQLRSLEADLRGARSGGPDFSSRRMPIPRCLVSGNKDNIQLFVNSKPDASTSKDLDTQLLLAHGPLFLAPEARTLLVIGYGSGITAGSALKHRHRTGRHRGDLQRRAQRRDYLQGLQLPGTRRSAGAYLPRRRTKLSAHRPLSLRRHHLGALQPLGWPGIGGLFTVEFFETVRRQLNPGGVFTLWFHTYEQSDEGTRLLVRTLGSVFPHVTLFGDDDMGNLVAVASMERIEPDFEAMERRFEEPAIREDLARLGISNLLTFLSHHRISQDTFSEMIDPGEFNRIGHERPRVLGTSELLFAGQLLFHRGARPPGSRRHRGDGYFIRTLSGLSRGSGSPADLQGIRGRRPLCPDHGRIWTPGRPVDCGASPACRVYRSGEGIAAARSAAAFHVSGFTFQGKKGGGAWTGTCPESSR